MSDGDILFVSLPEEKFTTFEKRGDKLALYTKDDKVYQRFRKWGQLLYKCNYLQGNHIVAVDLYFPLTAKKQLLKALTDGLK